MDEFFPSAEEIKASRDAQQREEEQQAQLTAERRRRWRQENLLLVQEFLAKWNALGLPTSSLDTGASFDGEVRLETDGRWRKQVRFNWNPSRVLAHDREYTHKWEYFELDGLVWLGEINPEKLREHLRAHFDRR